MVSAFLFRRCCRLRCHRRAFLNNGCALRLLSSTATKPKSSQPGADVLLPLEDVDIFSGDRGFWPQKQGQEPFFHKNASPVVISQEEGNANKQEAPNSPTPTLPSHLTPKARPRKIIVSQLGSKAVRANRWGLFSKIRSGFFRPSFQSKPPAFRSNQGLRNILAVYVNSLAPLLPALDLHEAGDQVLAPLDRQLLSVFSKDVVDLLSAKGHDPVDVVSWAWIFSSDTISLSVHRYVALTNDLRKQSRPNIPRFVVLQLLRADNINATSLHAMLSSLRRSADEHPLHVVEADGTSIIDIEQAMATAWDYNSAMILAVRLLRHARLVAPDMFDHIIELACMMLFSMRDKVEGFGRLTYMCNRLLTLVSLPTSVKSRRSAREQQKAQLSLLRRMFAQKPQVPITREGYRALIKLQLLHEKTEEEKQWAGAKSESWPPWQKSKVGMEDKLQYSGKESRAMKMLRRMAEAGYAHQAWEKAAAIIAGWDTDKSPTIQSRAILDMPPMAAFVSLFDDVGDDSPYVTAQLWTARIVATRSVREAWACFAEYRQTVKDADKRTEPYHAMFEKLLARPRQLETKDNVLPGDAKETWLDPTSDRDLVYLEKEVPTNEDFYALMLSDGVRPAGRLLTLLVRNAKTLNEGIQYLESSTYPELKKDVLLHSLKYPDSVIRDIISSIPNHFFAAFLGLLSRVYDLDIMTTTYVAYSSNQWQSPTGKLLKPEEYALDLLFASETTYVPAYNAILEGVYLRLEKRKQQPEQTRRSLRPRMIFQIALIVVNHMAKRNIQPDLTTFHRFGSILRLCLKPPVIWSPSSEMALREVKRVFTLVVYGTHKDMWLPATNTDRIITTPDPEHLRLLIEILGIEQDIAGLLELAEWMSQHSERLQENYAEMASGEQSMKKALFGLRVFLEGAWANDFDWDMGISVATEGQIAQTAEKLQPLGWPTPDEMADFVEVNYSWLQWLRKAVWHRRDIAEEATAIPSEADKADPKTAVSSKEAGL